MIDELTNVSSTALSGSWVMSEDDLIEASRSLRELQEEIQYNKTLEIAQQHWKNYTQQQQHYHDSDTKIY